MSTRSGSRRSGMVIEIVYETVTVFQTNTNNNIIDLGQQGAEEDKLTSKATSFAAVCYGPNVEEDMTSHRYQMRKSKIVDHIQYGWHAGNDGKTLYPTTLTVGVSDAPLTILHLVKCHVQCSAVTMLDQTVVTNRPGSICMKHL